MSNVDLCLKQNWFILMHLNVAVSASHSNWSHTWSHSGFIQNYPRDFYPYEIAELGDRVQHQHQHQAQPERLSDLFAHKASCWAGLTGPSIPPFLHARRMSTGQLSQLAPRSWLLCNTTMMQRVHSSAERGIFLFKLQSKSKEISKLNWYLKKYFKLARVIKI